MQEDSPSADPASPGDGSVDLAAMDFDERLAYMATQIPTGAAVTKPAIGFGEEPILGTSGGGPETKFWTKEFWTLCRQDLQDLEWPSRKQVFQTLFTSQIAFAVIIVITLAFDTTVETLVKKLLSAE